MIFQGEPIEDSCASPRASPADALEVVGTGGAEGTVIYNRDRHIWKGGSRNMCLFFLSYGLDLFFSSLLPPWVSKVSTLGARERGISGLRLGRFTLHIAESFLEGSGVGLLSLMQQGKTPGLLPVFSCLLCLGCYSQKLGNYLEIMNAYRYALLYASV